MSGDTLLRKNGRTIISKAYTKVKGYAILLENNNLETLKHHEICGLLERINATAEDLWKMDAQVKQAILEDEDEDETQVEAKLDAEDTECNKYRTMVYHMRGILGLIIKHIEMSLVAKVEQPSVSTTPSLTTAVGSDDAVNMADMVAKATAEAVAKVVAQQDRERTGRLPEIRIRKFRGCKSEYRSFIDIFQHEVGKKNISKLSKFNYLQDHLEGSALSKIAGLRLTEANYDTALKILEENYGQATDEIDEHLTALEKVRPVHDNENLLGLRSFSDFVNKHIKALEGLGVKLEDYSLSFYSCLVGSLPEEVVIDFHEQYVKVVEVDGDDKSRNSSRAEEIKALLKFLDSKLVRREQYLAARSLSHPSGSRSGRNYSGGGQNEHRSNANFRPKFSGSGGAGGYGRSEFGARGGQRSSIFTVTSTVVCIFCGNSHPSIKCNAAFTFNQRREVLQRQRLCFKCFSGTHQSKDCNFIPKCDICGFTHQTVMHIPGPGRGQPGNFGESRFQSVEQHRSPNYGGRNNGDYIGNVQGRGGLRQNLPVRRDEVVSGTARRSNDRVIENSNAAKVGVGCLLFSVTVWAVGPDGKKVLVRALIDPGATEDFVAERLGKNLGLETVAVKSLTVQPFMSSPIEIDARQVKVRLQSVFDEKLVLDICPVEIESTACRLPAVPKQVVLDECRRRNFKLADAYLTGQSASAEIEIMISMKHYLKLIRGTPISLLNDTFVQDTIFGYCIGGVAGGSSVLCSSIISVNNVSVLPKEDLECFWDLEHIGIKPETEESIYSKDELSAIQQFEDSINFKDGRYHVGFPYVKNVAIGDNKKVALSRLFGLLSRLEKNGSEYAAYDKMIMEYVEEFAEEIPVNEIEVWDDRVVYWVPHHLVIGKKPRIVFDFASFLLGFKSFNDNVLQGPNLNPDLVSMLLRFRTHKIGVTADITWAFLQIGLVKADCDATRFLWRRPGEKQIRSFRFLRLPFGPRPSPFILAATLRHHFKESKAELGEALYEKLCESFYVDDFVSGEDSVESAKILVDKTFDCVAGAGMKLCKWNSNSKEVQEYIDVKYNSQVAVIMPDLFRVLGIYWDVSADQFLFVLDALASLALAQKFITKRSVLKISAKIYDPLGWLSPFVGNAKVLLQRIWREQLDWDIPLPEDLAKEWVKFTSGFDKLSSIRVDRKYGSELGRVVSHQLHIFTDASTAMYGACVYLRTVYENGQVKCSLVMSKSRVAPLKILTLARLELMGAVIGSRLYSYIAKELKLEVESVYFWTDSMITLQWIRSNDASKWLVFVANRLAEILSSTNVTQWRFVKGLENPADHLTRPMSADSLVACVAWWKGPQWLSKIASEWPTQPQISECRLEDCAEVKSTVMTCASATSSNLKSFVDLSRFSNFGRLVRVVARCLIFLRLRHDRSISREPDAGLIDKALKLLIRQCQFEDFESEILCLRAKRSISSSSVLANWEAFLDEESILRLKTRLSCSRELSFDQKFPVVISDKSRLAYLLIERYHRLCAHGGTTTTLSAIRDQYFIIRGRQTVRAVVSKCVTCKLLRGRAGSEVVAPLPRYRVDESPPFFATGVDFCGPFRVKVVRNIEVKVYVALFTCMVTRAVHLELVSDLTTGKFLLAFRRFVSRRALPKRIYSDNGLTFKRAKVDLERLFDMLKDVEFKSYFADKRIEWSFIPPRAPFWGGFYERMVGCVKNALKGTLGKSLLQYEEFETVLIEVEVLVNKRPLTCVPNDPHESVSLTPIQILNGYNGESSLPPGAVPTEALESNPQSLARVWKNRQHIIVCWWKRFKEEYLLQLRSVHNVQGESRQVKLNDIVLLNDEMQPRLRWKRGKIVDIHPGRDGKVRCCTVMLPSGLEVRRAIQYLYPLEVV